MGGLSRQQKTTASPLDECTSLWPGCRPTGTHCLSATCLTAGLHRACAEENRVASDRLPFYVNWAKTFTNFLPGKPLKERTGEDIEAFLVDLRKRRGIADWQVRQAEHALTMLYENFLPHYAPEKYAAVAPAGKHPLREATTKTDKFRDHVTPGEVERQFSDLVEAVKTEVRSRHYSYRTETSYLDWVRRFIAFHAYADPRGLDASAAVR